MTQPIENAFNYERELIEVANRRLTMILKDLHSEGIISIKSHEEEYDELSPYHDHINRYGRILNQLEEIDLIINDQKNDQKTMQETINETIKTINESRKRSRRKKKSKSHRK